MFTQKTGPFTLIVTLAAAATASYADAQKRESANESPAKIAREVYDLLISQYRSGESGGVTQLESLNNWSLKILHAEFSALTLEDGVPGAEDVQRSIRNHGTRMQELERIAEKKYISGSASKSELLAARYFRLEGKGIEPAIKAIQQMIQPVEGDFDIKMPKVDEAKPLKEKAPSVVIDVDARGKITIEGKELTLEQLEHELKRIATEDPRSAKARIRAHPNGLHRNVMSACRVCAKVGIESISLVIADDAEEE